MIIQQKKHRHIRNEQCPECAKLGKDTNKDNLAVYSNGKWCFSCGYQENTNGIAIFKEKLLSSTSTPCNTGIYLPDDSTLNYPDDALHWVEQYGLTKTDLLRNNAVYSPSYSRLIFPIYSENSLLAYQGRYFGKEKKPKWWGVGDLKNTFNIIGSDTKLILCEDIISAIKLSKQTMAMPLYGCSIGSERFQRLYKLLGYKFDVRIWLDPDMRATALKEARRGNQIGLKVSVIYSDKDPKEHTYEEIHARINFN